MTAEQIYLLRKSFDAVEAQAHVAALVFYRRLFSIDPSLRPLFKAGIEDQSRKLIDMLGLAVSLSARPAAFEAELRELGARHQGYGVREEHYETAGRAMIEMLAEVLVEDFTPKVREAWVTFYNFMAGAMKEGCSDPTLA